MADSSSDRPACEFDDISPPLSFSDAEDGECSGQSGQSNSDDKNTLSTTAPQVQGSESSGPSSSGPSNQSNSGDYLSRSSQAACSRSPPGTCNSGDSGGSSGGRSSKSLSSSDEYSPGCALLQAVRMALAPKLEKPRLPVASGILGKREPSRKKYFEPAYINTPSDFEGPSIPQTWHGKTTVLVRKLPDDFSIHRLQVEFKDTPFEAAFDFMYVPLDSAKGTCKGFAIINFMDDALAFHFRTTFTRFKLFRNVVEVLLAEYQGFEENFARFSDAMASQKVAGTGKTAAPQAIINPESMLRKEEVEARSVDNAGSKSGKTLRKKRSDKPLPNTSDSMGLGVCKYCSSLVFLAYRRCHVCGGKSGLFRTESRAADEGFDSSSSKS